MTTTRIYEVTISEPVGTADRTDHTVRVRATDLDQAEEAARKVLAQRFDEDVLDPEKWHHRRTIRKETP